MTTMNAFIILLIATSFKTIPTDVSALLVNSDRILNVTCKTVIVAEDGYEKVKLKVISSYRGSSKDVFLHFEKHEIAQSIYSFCLGPTELKYLFRADSSYTIFMDKYGRLIGKFDALDEIELLVQMIDTDSQINRNELCRQILKNRGDRINELLAELAAHEEYGNIIESSVRKEILLTRIKSEKPIRSMLNERTNIVQYMWKANDDDFNQLLLNRLGDREFTHRKTLIYWSKLSPNQSVVEQLTRMLESKEEKEEMQEWITKAIRDRKKH